MNEGASLLNVRFTDEFKDALVKYAYDSVHIVQEVCRRACINQGIYRTQETHQEVGPRIDVAATVREVVDEQSARYTSFVTQFADGFQETSLEMYKWLLYPILTTTPDELEHGLRYQEIRQTLQGVHPSGKDLNPGNITQALQSTASLQVSKDMKPIILDYDQTTRRLNVVDRGFLIWLAQQEQSELLDEAGLPTSLSHKTDRLY